MTPVLGKMVSKVWLAGARYFETSQGYWGTAKPRRCSDNTSKTALVGTTRSPSPGPIDVSSHHATVTEAVDNLLRFLGAHPQLDRPNG